MILPQPEDIIDVIINDLRRVQADIAIAKAMYDKEYPEPNNFLEMAQVAAERHKDEQEYFKAMYYNDGKFDAYVKILTMYGINFDRNASE